MDSIKDAAWFYSTLAQVSAAIVGLIGAVLGSRILDHVPRMRENRKQIDRKIRNAPQTISRRIAELNAFERYLNVEIAEDEAAIQANRPTRQKTRWMDWVMDAPRSDRIQPVNPVEDRDESNRLLGDVRRIRPAYPNLRGMLKDGPLTSYLSVLREAADKVPGARGVAHPKSFVLGDADLLQDVADDVAAFRSNLLPASFRFIFVLLIWLTVFGVIWPLWALPGFTTGEQAAAFPKDWMLKGVIAGLVGLLGYFLIQFIEIGRLGRLTWDV